MARAEVVERNTVSVGTILLQDLREMVAVGNELALHDLEHDLVWPEVGLFHGQPSATQTMCGVVHHRREKVDEESAPQPQSLSCRNRGRAAKLIEDVEEIHATA